MRTPARLAHRFAVLRALLAGLPELAALQAWRLRERLSRHAA